MALGVGVGTELTAMSPHSSLGSILKPHPGVGVDGDLGFAPGLETGMPYVGLCLCKLSKVNSACLWG